MQIECVLDSNVNGGLESHELICFPSIIHLCHNCILMYPRSDIRVPSSLQARTLCLKHRIDLCNSSIRRPGSLQAMVSPLRHANQPSLSNPGASDRHSVHKSHFWTTGIILFSSYLWLTCKSPFTASRNSNSGLVSLVVTRQSLVIFN